MNNDNTIYTHHERNLTSIIREKDDEIKELKDKNEEMSKENITYKKLVEKLQHLLSNKTEHLNNTSSNFPLKSEFTNLWNGFVNIDMLSCFIEFTDNPMLLYHLLNEAFYLMYQNLQSFINSRIHKIFAVLNLPKNDKTCIEDLVNTIRPFFKEYLDNIFTTDTTNSKFAYNDFYIQYKKFFNNFLLKYLNDDNDKKKYTNVFNSMIKQRDFIILLNHIKEIILFTEFNEPKLNLNIKSFDERKPEIKEMVKSECLIFDKCFYSYKANNKIRVLILQGSPLYKSGFAFSKSILPIVLCVREDFKCQLVMHNNTNVQEEKIENHHNTIQTNSQNHKPQNNSIQSLKQKAQIFSREKFWNIIVNYIYPYVIQCKQTKNKSKINSYNYKGISREKNLYNNNNNQYIQSEFNKNKKVKHFRKRKFSANMGKKINEKEINHSNSGNINQRFSNVKEQSSQNKKKLLIDKKRLKIHSVSHRLTEINSPKRTKRTKSNANSFFFKNINKTDESNRRSSSFNKKSHYQDFIWNNKSKNPIRNIKEINCINLSKTLIVNGNNKNNLITITFIPHHRLPNKKIIGITEKVSKKKYINLLKNFSIKASLSNSYIKKTSINHSGGDKDESSVKNKKYVNGKIKRGKDNALTERSQKK